MLGLGVEVQQDAVPQARGGQGRDILIRDVIPAVRERADLGAQDDELVTASTSTTGAAVGGVPGGSGRSRLEHPGGGGAER